jgi:cystathionine gamma-synthase
MSIDTDATDEEHPADLQLDPASSVSQSRSTQSMDGSEHHGLSTKSVHAGEHRQKPEGAIATPIFTASTYTFDSTKSLLRFVDGIDEREEYGRYGTPNERSVEAKLAALEGSEEAIIYSSGMAAIVGLLMSRLNAGDEIVFFDQCYRSHR